jgi:drug/metabolite transporter (DMT)-like permease
MPFYIFAWIASVAYGGEVVLTKLTSKYSVKNPWLFNFLWNVILAVMIAPIAYFNGVGMPKVWGNIFLAGATTAIFSSIYIYVLYKIDVSVVAPLFNFKTIFALLLGALLLGEKIYSWQYPLIAVTILAGFFVTYNEKFSLKSFFNSDVALLIISMAVLAFYYVFLNRAITDVGYWNATFWTTLPVPFFLLPTAPFFKNDIRKVNLKQIGSLVVVSTAGVIGVVTSNVAYAVNIGISSLIISIPFSMIIAVILAFFWPKLLEKHTAKVYAVRLLAAGVMIACALKLSA